MRFLFFLLYSLASPLLAAELSMPNKQPLWTTDAPDGSGGRTSPEQSGITVYPAPHPNGMAAVICPGGGYGALVTGAEGHGIAKWLNGHGITGIVLEYRLPAGRARVPLLDAQRALRITRSRAAEWKVDPAKIGIIGFSAGGHLAATASTQFDLGLTEASDPVDRQSCRPDFAILIYPVITLNELTHVSLRDRLLGASPSAELVRRFSCERMVSARTTPTFLAHAVDDKGVVIEHSRLYAAALKSNGVTHRLLELPDGGHGLNGYKGPSWDAWQRESLVWLKSLWP